MGSHRLAPIRVRRANRRSARPDERAGPSSIRFAKRFSSSAVRRSVRPISRRYIRTGSSISISSSSATGIRPNGPWAVTAGSNQSAAVRSMREEVSFGCGNSLRATVPFRLRFPLGIPIVVSVGELLTVSHPINSFRAIFTTESRGEMRQCDEKRTPRLSGANPNCPQPRCGAMATPDTTLSPGTLARRSLLGCAHYLMGPTKCQLGSRNQTGN